MSQHTITPTRTLMIAPALALTLAACEEQTTSSEPRQPAPQLNPTTTPSPSPTTDTGAMMMPVTAPAPAPDPMTPMPMVMPADQGMAGAPAAPPPAADTCGADPANPGDGICPGGLVCGDPTGTMNYACMCPNSPTMLPPCTMGGPECQGFPGTTCSNLFGAMGCHTSCTPPGVAPPSCPDPLQCADPLGTGVAFCVMAGQITPPPCAVQEDCAMYEGTFCMDPLALGILGCVKSCAL